MTPCKCGYQDHRFCPLHGRALRKVIKAACELGAEAAERAVEAFADTDGDGHDVEDVCLGCVTGALDHDDACKGPPKADTPARRAFLRFMWGQPGLDAADVRIWALAERPVFRAQLRSWLQEAVGSTKELLRWDGWKNGEAWSAEKVAELAVFQAFLREVTP